MSRIPGMFSQGMLRGMMNSRPAVPQKRTFADMALQRGGNNKLGEFQRKKSYVDIGKEKLQNGKVIAKREAQATKDFFGSPIYDSPENYNLVPAGSNRLMLFYGGAPALMLTYI